MQVRQLLEKNEKGQVIATCRNPSGATGLIDLKNKFAERLDILQLDLTIENTIEVSASLFLFLVLVQNLEKFAYVFFFQPLFEPVV